MEGAFEELVVNPYTLIAARLLSEHATEAGLDPFLESLTAAERLALLLERLDELPLRRHEIRGNAAGLLARIVDRIDALKAAGVTAERFREWAEGLGAGQAGDADLDAAAREREFARDLRAARLDDARRGGGRRRRGGARAQPAARGASRARRRRRGALPPPDRRRARGRLPGRADSDRAAGAERPHRGALLRRRAGAGAMRGRRRVGARDPGQPRGGAGSGLALRRRPSRRSPHCGVVGRRRRRGPPPRRRAPDQGPLLAQRQRAGRGPGRRPRDRVDARRGRAEDGGPLHRGAARGRPPTRDRSRPRGAAHPPPDRRAGLLLQTSRGAGRDRLAPLAR